MKNTKRKAFTLVELLVVIAIIGILFVVLISKVDFATEKAKAAGVQTDFRSYQLAIETVARENAGLSTLVDNETSGEEKYAALEDALNKNLDPKLHIEIDTEGKISTEAKDPWREEYTGQYLAPDTDGTVKDRGAIVMYSKGSNLKLGTTSETVNGVVNVTLESGKEAEGADDYSISTVYTYVNGYGEIKTTTDGFSNDMGESGNDSEQGEEQEPVRLAAGLYDAEDNLVASWDELVNTYGMNVEVDNVYDNTVSPYYVLTNNDALAAGSKLVISDSVTRIGQRAFQNYTGLTSITIGSGVTSIEMSAFDGCTGLTNVEIGSGLTSIGSCAFSDCSGLTNVDFGNGVTSIGFQAFYKCTGLTGNLVIPDSVTSIGSFSFAHCSGLTNVTIPNSVTSIGEYAFVCDSMLSSVTIESSTFITYLDSMLGACSSLTAIYVPSDLVEQYKAAAGWIDFADKIQAIPTT